MLIYGIMYILISCGILGGLVVLSARDATTAWNCFIYAAIGSVAALSVISLIDIIIFVYLAFMTGEEY